MTLRSKMVILAVFPIALGAIALSALLWMNNEIIRTREIDRAADAINKNIFDLSLGMQEYLRNPEQRPKVQFKVAWEELKRNSDDLLACLKEDQKTIENIHQNHQTLMRVFPLIVAVEEERGSAREGVAQTDLKEMLVGQMTASFSEMTSDVRRISRTASAATNRILNRSFHLSLILFLFSATGIVILTILTGRTVATSVAKLKKGAEAVSGGDLRHVVEIQSPDELGALAKSFNGMTAKLRDSFVSIKNLQQEIAQRERAEGALREKEKALEADLDAMTRLQKIGTLFVREGNMEPVLGEIVDTAIAISGADFGNIQLLGPSSSDLHIMAARGFPEWWLDFWDSVSKGKGTCGTALERGERVIVEDVEQSPIFVGTPALEIQLKAGVRGVQSTPLTSRSGKPLGMFSTHYKTPHRPDDRALRLLDLLARQAADIIDRAQGEEQLRESEEKSRLLLKHAPSMLYEIDFHRPAFKSVNDAMCQLLGYSREELLAMSPFDLLEEEGKALFRERIRRKLAGELIPDSVEYKSRAKNGREIYGVLNMSFTYKDGKPEGAVVVAHDITERKKAEEALKKSYTEMEQRVQERTSELSKSVERLRAENIQRKRLEEVLRDSENQVRFFASQCLTAQETERRRIAGELHDSIAASIAAAKFRIENIAEQMKQGNGGPDGLDDVSSKLMEINNDVRRIMADLRPSILDDLGIIPAIDWFCREFEKTYSWISVEKQVAILDFEVPESLKTPIFRICQEAMNNIAKYSKASLVNLLLRKEDGKIQFSIQDNGQGFELETVKKGMGLSTMKERAELSGGSFEIESAVGNGTTVRLSWPI